MHEVGDIQQGRSTIDTELITFGILLRTAVPAMLIALMINHLVDMFFGSLAHNLTDLIAPIHGRTNRQYWKIAC